MSAARAIAIASLARTIADTLAARGQTLGVCESAAGGRIAAALLATPGASRFFVGGAVVYTAGARQALLDIGPGDLVGMRPSTEPYALLLARRIRQRLGVDWAIGETGAAGPTGNRYGDAAGHACVSVVGALPDSAELIARATTVETASTDRSDNMDAFTQAALRLLAQTLTGEA